MPPEQDTVDALTRVLVRACRKLAENGRPGLAGRLAADGWVVVRGSHPRQARHLDGAMHHIARIEEETEHADVTRSARAIRKDPTMAPDEHVLDVRDEIPKRRHELIFATFAELAAGSAYVLVNDHDPLPLYYQLAAENPGQFSWEYLESGPEVWRVRIGRTTAAAV